MKDTSFKHRNVKKDLKLTFMVPKTLFIFCLLSYILSLSRRLTIEPILSRLIENFFINALAFFKSIFKGSETEINSYKLI